MIYDARELARVRNIVLLISALGWILLMVDPGWMPTFAHCTVVGSTSSLRMLAAMNSPASLAAGWALMLVAMMSLVLILPVYDIRMRSFAHRRVRSIVLFIIGYAGMWMLAGGVLLAVALVLGRFASPWPLTLAGFALVALIWQCSPLKQRCLNRCHAQPGLAAFGMAADFDALRFGLIHGAWCAGSCWALMLFPMLLPRGHIVAMAIVTLLIFSERLEEPRPPCWRWRGFGRLTRVAIAQAKIRLQADRILPAGSQG